MDARSRLCAGTLLSLSLLAALAAEAAPSAASKSNSSDHLVPFASEEELAKYIAKLPNRRRRGGGGDEEIVVTGFRASEVITNTQTEGVDEGGIVKVHGDHLVVLRRGRLFTVSIADGKLEPVYWTNTYASNMDPDATWYDEMLVHDDRVIVIGYSYERGGTEVALFDINAAGKLRYEATYHLRSDDYFSSRNYASRLVDGKLIFYSPLPLSDMDSLPALRRWPQFAPEDRETFEEKGFSRIAPAQKIFRPVRPVSDPWSVLHTITTCDLEAPEFRCEAVGVIGTSSEVFYVSASAVYVWTEVGESHADSGSAIVYRLPLDGSPPTALSAVGIPIDQFSFLEADGYLNTLVASDSSGNWMWNAESEPGDIALLRVRLSLFGDGTNTPDLKHYTPLPLPSDENSLTNRFVNGRLLYGLGERWYGPEGRRTELYVTEIETGATKSVRLPHSVDRIEVIRSNAVVIGTDAKQNLYFSGIELGQIPRRKQRFMLKDAAQGEVRSHGFFYSPDESADGGMLGLPVRGGGKAGWRHLRENSAGILFLRDESSSFNELGRLYGESIDDDDDGCEASCVDWYGNARPIFLRGRIYALLGYELVEGTIRGSSLREVRRVNFMPFAL